MMELTNTTTSDITVAGSSLNQTLANVTAASECFIPSTLEMVPDPLYQYFLIGLYSLTSLLALVGNLTVILVSILGSESAPTIRLCLANLAVSDIILGVLCVPFTYTDFLWGQWVFPHWLCPTAQFVQLLSVFVTSLTLTVIGVERYMATLRPFSSLHRWLCTHTRLLLSFTWIFGCLYAFIPFEHTGTRAFSLNNATYFECSYDNGLSVSKRRLFMATNLLLTFLLPLFVLITAYTAIMRKLLADRQPAKKGSYTSGTTSYAFSNGTTTASSERTRPVKSAQKKLVLVAKLSPDGSANSEMANGSHDRSPTETTGSSSLRAHNGRLKNGHCTGVVNLRKSASANRSKTIKMLFVVMALYGLCWAPIKLYQFLLDYGILSYCSEWSLNVLVATYFSCHWLAMANSAVNPFCYSFMSRNFRNDFRRITSSCWPGRPTTGKPLTRHYSLKTASTFV